jgi:adenylate cyclase
VESKFKIGLRWRPSIGAKLISLIAVLLLVSLVVVVSLSTHLFIQDNTALIQQMNADTAASLATQTQNLFRAITDKMRLLGMVMMREATSHTEAKDSIAADYFSKDEDFLGVFIYEYDAQGKPNLRSTALSPEMAALGDKDGEKSKQLLESDAKFNLVNVAHGEVQLTVMSSFGDSPILALAIPFIKSSSGPSFSHSLVALIKETKFTKTFSDSDIATCYLVGPGGKLFAHSDVSLVSAGENFSHVEIVQRMLEGKFGNGETRYLDTRTRTAKLASFRIVGFAGLGVVAEVPEAKALAAAKKVQTRAALFTGIVLCLAFLLGYLYSDTITWPIQKLADAAIKVSQGDFSVQLRSQSKDEIGKLTATFNEMVKGLIERDKVKATFNKFHNKEIAEKILAGEVKLGGEKKHATVFFSDIRGFTAISESLPPEKVVELVNEYMTCMVTVIRNYNGVVDKYVGDAIMALWGVPIETADDTYNAVKACLAMRIELETLNDRRISRGEPVLKIGMGLNAGELIAGNIGSEERMEYTVIGDAVNTASRIESMTKEFGTDFLVSASVYALVKDKFVFESLGGAKVKGKTEALEVFRVTGYLDEAGAPVIIETPYSSYESTPSDKAVHEIKVAA